MTTASARREWHHLALVAFVVTLACLPLLILGAQAGHSLPYNLTWSGGFTAQLLQGEVYPRWLMSLNEGLGSPVFFFYAPLPFYFTAAGALVCSGCALTTHLAIGEWLILLCSGLTFWLLARHHAPATVATFGAVVYALAPYHFGIDLLIRQALGETAAYIWFPLLVLVVDRMSAGNPRSAAWLSLTYAGLIMTHLPSALLFSPFLLAYAGVLSYHTARPKLMLEFAAGIVTGILLGAVYLLPALLSLDYIMTDKLWPDSFHYDRWFFLDGVDSPDPRMESGMLGMLAMYTGAFLAFWIVAFRHYRAQRSRVVPLTWLAIFLGAWFLMTPLSRFVWELLPFLQKVQFPWRVIVVQDLALAVMLVVALDCIRSWRSERMALLAVLAACGVLLASSTFVAAWRYNSYLSNMSNDEYQQTLSARLGSGYDTREYIPIDLPRETLYQTARSLRQVEYERANGHVTIVHWKPRNIRLDVSLRRDTTLTIRQFRYPGWEALIDDSGTRLEIAAGSSLGLLQITAPAGDYALNLRLRPLWQEISGWSLSAAGVLILLLLLRGRTAE